MSVYPSATPTTIMSSVWVQLHNEGKDEPEGRPVEIEPIPKNVGALAKEVKKDMAEELTHCSAAEIVVYFPDNERPLSERTPIRGDKTLKELIGELGNKNPGVSIDYDHPLIVVAPAPKQADGKKRLDLVVGFWFIVEFIQIVLC